MIDKNKKYKTREGKEVRIYATDAGGYYPIHGARQTEYGWVAESWTCDGSHIVGRKRCCDLVEITPNLVENNLNKETK